MNPFQIGKAIGTLIMLPYVLLIRLIGWKGLALLVGASIVAQILMALADGDARSSFLVLALALWVATAAGAARILGWLPQSGWMGTALDTMVGPAPFVSAGPQDRQSAPRPQGSVPVTAPGRSPYSPTPLVPADIAEARNALSGAIAGRQEVLATILESLEVTTFRRDRTRPAGVFIIVGEPGGGASYVARTLAAALRRPAIEIDISVPDLAAAGLDELSACLPHFPSAVAILDRVDKLGQADASIIATALRNDGFVEDANRQRIATRDAVFIILTTTRARETLAMAAGARTAAERTARLKTALEGAIPDELLERADAIVHLGRPDASALAAFAAERLEAAAKAKGVKLAHPAVSAEMLATLASVAESAMEDGMSFGATLDRFAVWADRALAGARPGSMVMIEGDDPANPRLVHVDAKGRAYT